MSSGGSGKGMGKFVHPIFIMYGGPGAGKGTQCAKLVTKYGLCHLSSSDLLRAEVASGTPRGSELQRMMTDGELVPIPIVLALIRDAMEKALKAGTNGYLIDGCWKLKQRKQFEASIGAPTLLVYFEVPHTVLTARLLERGKSSGRVDDNAETIKKRLDTYHEMASAVVNQGKLLNVDADRGRHIRPNHALLREAPQETAPVITHYGGKGKLLKVDATGTVDAVFAQITPSFTKHLKK